MKSIAIALAILSVAHEILTIEKAQAAGLLDRDQNTAEEYQPSYAFAGIAIGLDGGGQFTSVDISEGSSSFDGISADGLIGGGHLEYLFGADRFRFGGYGEGGFSNVNTELQTSGPSGDLLTQDSYYGFGLKGGFTVYGSTLIYGRAGYDWSQWTAGGGDFGDSIDVDVGSWLLGGGIDTMVSPNVSLGVGVDYLMVDDVNAAGKNLSEFLNDSEIIRAKTRLTYHF